MAQAGHLPTIREVFDRILGKSVTPIVAETRGSAVVNDGILHELRMRAERDSTVIDAECIDDMVASQKKKKDRHHTNASFRNSGDTYWTWEIAQEDRGDEKKEEGIMRPPANSGIMPVLFLYAFSFFFFFFLSHRVSELLKPAILVDPVSLELG